MSHGFTALRFDGITDTVPRRHRQHPTVGQIAFAAGQDTLSVAWSALTAGSAATSPW